MLMIDKITQVLNSFSKKWACLLSNGTIVETTLPDQSFAKTKTLRILKKVIQETEAGSVVFYSDLVVYRPTTDFFIFVIGRYPRNTVKEKFAEISRMYKGIDKEYKKETRSYEVKLKLVLFSMNLDEGPTPIFYMPKSFDDAILYKVCMKSMLALSIEKEGAVKSMVSFQPFVDIKSLGIVYTFQIEDEKARGGAYDCAITVLVDYKYRALIYESYELIEKAFKEMEKEVEAEYWSTKDYKSIFNTILKKYFSNVTFETVEPVNLKEEMMDEIKKLARL